MGPIAVRFLGGQGMGPMAASFLIELSIVVTSLSSTIICNKVLGANRTMWNSRIFDVSPSGQHSACLNAFPGKNRRRPRIVLPTAERRSLYPFGNRKELVIVILSLYN
jgi:hypothetical protein